MRAWQIEGQFGLENLVLRDLADPEPKAGQIVLELEAISLNYRDWLMVEGHYDPRQPLPLIPCSDGVGRVAAVGPGVSGWRVGDRACPTFAQEWISGEPTYSKVRSTLGGPLPGTLASHIVVAAEGLVRPPEHLDAPEAACLPCAGLTAWSAISTLGGVRSGETVLILGTGGVALAALQFARTAGARVIITSSSQEKLSRARELGASETLHYPTDERWGRSARQLTDGRGVDLVVEVGGAATLPESLDAVRFGGTIALIGVLSGVRAPLSVTSILMKQVRVQGVLVGSREGFEAMNRALAVHQIRPIVDTVFDFEAAPDAFRHLLAANHFGKVCLRL